VGLLTFSLNVTLDGCVDHQEGIADDETHAFFTRLMDEGGAMLWGRVTYEMMESYWPAVARGDEEATPAVREWAINLEAKPKYVVSSTRSDFPWTNSHHIAGDLRTRVQKLKDATPDMVTVVATLPFLLFGVPDGLAQSAADVPTARATSVTMTDRFDFHSDPWVNLHQFLYQWAREAEGLGTGRQHVSVPERSSFEELPDGERGAWLQAITFYRQSVAQRSHFDGLMLQQKRMLLELGGHLRGEVPDVIPGIGAVLALAMPVYWSKWWPAHDRANRAWIASVQPLVQRHEPRFGVETLFHEVQHTREVGGTARAELEKAFEVAGSQQPTNLWHSLIFATAGAFAQSIAAREELPEHVPYWIREGFEEGFAALASAFKTR
jgi:hypothetical protein